MRSLEYKVVIAACPLCDKQFKDRRGLQGHFRFVHGVEYNSGRPAKKTALTEAIKRSIEKKKKKENELIDETKQGKYMVILRSEVEQREKTLREEMEEAWRTAEGREMKRKLSKIAKKWWKPQMEEALETMK